MADRRTFEEIVADIREEGLDHLAEELEKGYGKSTLREQAAKAAELEKRLVELEAENEALKLAPAREKAFADYGIDFDALKPLEVEALEGYKGELTKEAIGELVERYQLPTVAGSQTEPEPEPNAAAVVAAARSAPTGRVSQQMQITPDQVREWSADKWLSFKDQHPEEADQILQGKTVTGLSF